MEDRLDKLLRIEKENNLMLKKIIRYINHIEYKASQENIDDFGRNVIANLVSNKFFKK